MIYSNTIGITYVEEAYLQYEPKDPTAEFLAEFEFSRRNIDVFSSEASRCENVIYPLLRDVYKQYANQYSLWSHTSLTYDEVLTGIPDYLITSKSSLGKTMLGCPLVMVVEAKQNNFIEGWGQCLAELVAAQKLNKNEQLPVHGIVTDGEVWHFGKLITDTFIKNKNVLALTDLKNICGAISSVIQESIIALHTEHIISRDENDSRHQRLTCLKMQELT